jgi:peptidyl-prolyl cis-trans isomerase B (cyclophilin B)
MKILITLILLTGAIAMTACAYDDAYTPLLQEQELPPGAAEPTPPPEAPVLDADFDPNIPHESGLPWVLNPLLTQSANMLQLQPPTTGEELAVLHTTMGDITLRFFPSEAPLAVENWLTKARAGEYDGVIFHRVIDGFMIQGGCPEGTGRGGTSIWGDTFDLEFSVNLRHFRGALAMAHARGHMGSQFYIVQNSSLHPQYVSLFSQIVEEADERIGVRPDGTYFYVRDLHPPEAYAHFISHGGTPNLDHWWSQMPPAHPIFGHVVDGMDVVDAIALTPRDGDDRPLEDVIINSISFIYYGG